MLKNAAKSDCVVADPQSINPNGDVKNSSASSDSKSVPDARVIYFTGEFNETAARDFVQKLLDLESKNPLLDILVYIDSYGGYVDSFMAMHDAIKLCRCNVATVCLGKAMSCGQMLLISGTKGKRMITENSRVLIHQVSSLAYGRVSDMDNDISESKRLQALLEKLILKYTNITQKQLKDLMKKDSYLTAPEVLRLGLVDKIIYTPTDLFSSIKLK